jgi:hydrogenase nickel incorporation protein HypB
MQSLLCDNDDQAAHNRLHFAAAGTFVVNLMAPPGAGTTSLLDATIGALDGRVAVAATENDARRIRALGTSAVEITTGQCRLV